MATLTRNHNNNKARSLEANTGHKLVIHFNFGGHEFDEATLHARRIRDSEVFQYR